MLAVVLELKASSQLSLSRKWNEHIWYNIIFLSNVYSILSLVAAYNRNFVCALPHDDDVVYLNNFPTHQCYFSVLFVLCFIFRSDTTTWFTRNGCRQAWAYRRRTQHSASKTSWRVCVIASETEAEIIKVRGTVSGNEVQSPRRLDVVFFLSLRSNDL